MNITIWIFSGLLGALSVLGGANKALKPQESLTKFFSVGTVKFIGIAEIFGGLGLILPWATGIAPVLTPIAATGLVIIQVLAIAHHVRHKETKVLPINIVLLLAALFIAIGRFAQL